jgi:hypothetical protein
VASVIEPFEILSSLTTISICGLKSSLALGSALVSSVSLGSSCIFGDPHSLISCLADSGSNLLLLFFHSRSEFLQLRGLSRHFSLFHLLGELRQLVGRSCQFFLFHLVFEFLQFSLLFCHWFLFQRS